MESDHLFTDSDLTLKQLADRLDVSPHNLSEVINTRMGQNFFDFVNGYRVGQVKRDLVDPEKQNLKMLAIAFDAGFRSKSSFNQTFKKHVGVPPSEYRQKHTV
ncbi:helix-turn-helix domain-containing protein [bacterium]|nr:helix-turn-helix domain-containing protein [bacterium]